MSAYASWARPLLFALDPETSHRAAISLLKYWPAFSPPAQDPRLAVEAFGLRFPNPIGLAAGFDKHGEAIDGLFDLGFGHVEIGSVTPLPQPGNPRPRLFRLEQDFGVINRFGFNSQGHARVLQRLRRRGGRSGVVGINLGANKTSSDRAQDYVAGVEAFHEVASYFTINVSSPNTPGLRDLQGASALADLLARVLEARERVAARSSKKPVLLKIAPDLELSELDAVVGAARKAGVDGLIVSNTTVARPASLRTARIEEGGLSGRPLFELATRMLAATFLRVESAFPLVGVGGVESVETALAKIEAGATLVQLYSALVFEGPSLPRRILSGLSERLGGRGVQPAIGARAAAIAAGADLP